MVHPTGKPVGFPAEDYYDTRNYPKCHGCPYYFGEIDSCMFGEDDVPDNLEKKCHNKTEKDIEIGG